MSLTQIKIAQVSPIPEWYDDSYFMSYLIRHRRQVLASYHEGQVISVVYPTNPYSFSQDDPRVNRFYMLNTGDEVFRISTSEEELLNLSVLLGYESE